MRRIDRVAALAVLVLGWALGPVPAAQADTAGTATFVASLFLGPGVQAPCFNGMGTVDLTECDFGVSPKPAPGGKPGDTMVNITAPNSAPATLATDVCVGSAANVNKPAKLPVEAGVCSLTATGVATGFCGLLTGALTGTLTGSLPLVGQLQRYDFNVKFTLVNGLMYFSGPVTKRFSGATGWIKGAAAAVLVPSACTFGLPEQYLLDGEALFKILQ